MQRVLLDTQVLFLTYMGRIDAIPGKTLRILEDPDTIRLISSVSVMEIAVKHATGKVDMNEDRVQEAIRDLRLRALPFDLRHAIRFFSLPLHHRDPFDRAILATALAEDLPVISGDRIFRQYESVRVIW
ncbi:type II toxin-antitoxin system VapC family toxin [Paracidobacterium acidisoli]|uniref:Type II toxin-antitoxin system VapC family toxin n=1 Tax=Paracidobacterium acidisoli TaxID=2303751 RepID=A0A372IT03_9BACT|nr:type II toxin-antitoxin system VapC family toxin [Paracidobacterium acidisoli]MBT9329439.1 type II toxin-antitoxin system VapC family toxin [Paracidobacterium acidisoli]